MNGEFAATAQAGTIEYPPFVVEEHTRMELFQNPMGSGAGGLEADRQKLQTVTDPRGIELVVHDTNIEHAKNVEALDTHVTGTSILAIRAGDGGLSHMLDAIITVKEQRKREQSGVFDPPVLVIPGGHKNDLAHQLLNLEAYTDIELALLESVIRELYPTNLTIQRVDKNNNPTEEPVLRRAFAYGTIGPSSATAAGVNTEKYRNQKLLELPGGRFLAERWLALTTYCKSKPFGVEVNGDETRAIEWMVANGNLIAGSFHTSADPLLPEARIIQARSRLTGLWTLFAMGVNMEIGDKLEADQALTYIIDIPNGRTMHVQIDGEEYPISGRNMITAGVGQTTVSVLTTRKQ